MSYLGPTSLESRIRARSRERDLQVLSTRMQSQYSNGHFPSVEVTDHNIRILSLKPASTIEEPLHGFLTIVSLGSNPEFEALSYTWQPPFEDQVLGDGTISLAEFPTAINGNLNHALRRLRLSSGIRKLWVDAICINQDDVAERNHQITQMAAIYGRATRVLAWLGEDSCQQDGSSVFTMCETWLNSRHDILGRCLPQDHDSGSCYHRTIARDVERSLQMFLQRRYFRRRWVVQELFKASHILVLCGPHSIEWQTLSYFLRFGPEKFCTDPQIARYGGDIISFIDKRPLMLEAVYVGQLFVDCQSFKCSDDRDRLHALISMCDDVAIGGFHPDYSLDCDTTYSEFAACVMTASAGSWPDKFHFLHIAALQAQVSERCSQTLPSWAPDWRLELANDFRGVSTYDEYHFSVEHKTSLVSRVPCYGVLKADTLNTFSLTYDPMELFCSDLLLNHEIVVGPLYFTYEGGPRNACALILRPTTQGRHKLVGTYCLAKGYVHDDELKSMFRSTMIDVVIV